MDSWRYENRFTMTFFLVMVFSMAVGYAWGRFQGFMRGQALGIERGKMVNAAFVVSEIAQKLSSDSMEPLTEEQFADVQALIRVDELIRKADK